MLILAAVLGMLSGFFNTLIRLVIKKSATDNFLLMTGYLVTAVLSVPWLVYTGIPLAPPIFWAYLLFHVTLLLCAVFLTIEAHRASPLSLTTPYISLTPIFLLMLSPVLGTGKVTTAGMLGICLTVIGLYILHTSSSNKDIFGPIKAFTRERGSRLMAIAAIIYALTSVIDLYAVRLASPAMYLTCDFFFLGLFAFVIFCVRSLIKRKHVSRIRSDVRDGRFALIMFGILNIAVNATYLLALAISDNAPYIVTLKTGTTMLVVVLYGMFLSRFSEFNCQREAGFRDMIYRISGIIIIVGGITLITLYGKI